MRSITGKIEELKEKRVINRHWYNKKNNIKYFIDILKRLIIW
jgi:hypothetical protein